MKLYNFLNNYSFFQKMPGYKIRNIQDFGRCSKYLIEYQDKYYTLLIKKKTINCYIQKLESFDTFFKDTVKLIWYSEDRKVMVFDYYGGIDGHDLTYYHRNSIELPSNLSDRLITLLDNLHSHKAKFINVTKNKKVTDWYSYFNYMISKTLNKTLKLKGITLEEKKRIKKIILENKAYFDSVETCYIHADITSVNVCYNFTTDNLYLIDFDDFMIGDPFYDYSRMANFTEEISLYKEVQEKLYPDIENNIIHQLYTLRVVLNWYCFIIEKNLEFDLPINWIKYIINKLYELSSK